MNFVHFNSGTAEVTFNCKYVLFSVTYPPDVTSG